MKVVYHAKFTSNFIVVGDYRHILQDGYTEFRLPGFGSPGTPVAFWPDTNSEKSGL